MDINSAGIDINKLILRSTPFNIKRRKTVETNNNFLLCDLT